MERKRVQQAKAYFLVITTCGGYQVLRYFMFEAYWKAGHAAEYEHYEVSQEWISPAGKQVHISRLRASMCYYIDAWIKDSMLEVRTDSSIMTHLGIVATYPRIKAINELKRNGFSGKLHDMNPFELFTALLSSPHVETLFKAGQYRLLSSFMNDGTRIERYWPSVKICLRNGYEVVDSKIWCDMVDFLRELGKDTRSPKYVCPEDLYAAHDMYMRLIAEKHKRENEENRRREMEKYERDYKKHKRAFFGISFTDGTIHVRVLKSVKEFMIEGKSMHHCVYDAHYFEKEDSLILSAAVDGKRMETVEVSLNTLCVVQSRGVFNRNTEYHDRIVRLVQDNMYRIRKCLKSA